jgi:protein SOK2
LGLFNQYGYSNRLTTPQPVGQVPDFTNAEGNALPLPLPVMPTAQPDSNCGHSYGPQQGFDTTGQIAPPGMKPRVTATLWEDEGSLCFQVEARGVCVARREGKPIG